MKNSKLCLSIYDFVFQKYKVNVIFYPYKLNVELVDIENVKNKLNIILNFSSIDYHRL
jgi:hypothetical protein